jgi:hypothetical protein
MGATGVQPESTATQVAAIAEADLEVESQAMLHAGLRVRAHLATVLNPNNLSPVRVRGWCDDPGRKCR